MAQIVGDRIVLVRRSWPSFLRRAPRLWCAQYRLLRRYNGPWLSARESTRLLLSVNRARGAR
jgi:hypothetical protein